MLIFTVADETASGTEQSKANTDVELEITGKSGKKKKKEKKKSEKKTKEKKEKEKKGKISMANLVT